MHIRNSVFFRSYSLKNPYIDRKPTFYKTEGRKCILPPRQGGGAHVYTRQNPACNISKCYQSKLISNSRSYFYSVPNKNNSIFFRPKIRISSNVDLSEDEYYTQKLVMIRVKNTGHNTLHKCLAELSVLPLCIQLYL